MNMQNPIMLYRMNKRILKAEVKFSHPLYKSCHLKYSNLPYSKSSVFKIKKKDSLSSLKKQAELIYQLIIHF